MRFLAVDRPYVWTLAAAAFAFIFWQSHDASIHLRNPYVVTGWWVAALMTFLAIYNWRKRLSMVPLGSSHDWLSLHVAGGILTVGAFWMHAGFWPNGAYQRCLATLFYMVTLSGIGGWILQRIYPRFLTRTGVEVIYERIPKELYHLREQAEALVLACTETTGSDTLGRQYLENFDWYFRRPRFVVNHVFGGNRGESWVRQQSHTVARYLNDQERSFLNQLVRLAEHKTEIDFHYTAQSIMKGWLVIHVPLAAAAMVLAAWHVLLVYIYAL